MKVIKDTATQH